MPRINPVLRENANGSIGTTLDAVKSKVGFVPNLIATFANSPTALNVYLGVSEMLAGGRLTARQREVIALAVGQANTCQYCLSAHTAIGKSVGLSESAILLARSGSSEDPVTNAIAQLASKITTSRGLLEEVDIQHARAAGVDDGLIIEIISNVAFNILTNYTNHAAGTDIDFPIVKL